MKFFDRKKDEHADLEFAHGFDDAISLLDDEIYDRLERGLAGIPRKKKGRRRGYREAMAAVSDVFDLFAFREVSAREFSNGRAYWKATNSFQDGNGSISKEWDYLGD